MNKAFTEAFAVIEDTLEFNVQWNNGTGYYDHAVQGKNAPALEIGQVVKSISPMPNNRRLIMIGTQLGNIVLFDRFTAGQQGVVVCNCPHTLDQYVDNVSSQLSDETIQDLLGAAGNRVLFKENIGYRLNRLIMDKQLQVGGATTCQFGNGWDTSGYAEKVPVVVRAKSDGAVGARYLVDDTNGTIGVAIANRTSEKGELYCTNALTGVTVQQAAAEFGFLMY